MMVSYRFHTLGSARDVLQAHRAYYTSLPGVVGVGVGVRQGRYVFIVTLESPAYRDQVRGVDEVEGLPLFIEVSSAAAAVREL